MRKKGVSSKPIPLPKCMVCGKTYGEMYLYSMEWLKVDVPNTELANPLVTILESNSHMELVICVECKNKVRPDQMVDPRLDQVVTDLLKKS